MVRRVIEREGGREGREGSKETGNGGREARKEGTEISHNEIKGENGGREGEPRSQQTGKKRAVGEEGQRKRAVGRREGQEQGEQSITLCTIRPMTWTFRVPFSSALISIFAWRVSSEQCISKRFGQPSLDKPVSNRVKW